MPMHLSDFNGDAYITVWIGQIHSNLFIIIIIISMQRPIIYDYS